MAVLGQAQIFQTPPMLQLNCVTPVDNKMWFVNAVIQQGDEFRLDEQKINRMVNDQRLFQPYLSHRFLTMRLLNLNRSQLACERFESLYPCSCDRTFLLLRIDHLVR
jgi:hypothetical protein